MNVAKSSTIAPPAQQSLRHDPLRHSRFVGHEHDVQQRRDEADVRVHPLFQIIVVVMVIALLTLHSWLSQRNRRQ